MISVMMPVYNAGEFLPEVINSVLSQTEKNFELIIVNDGSTDNSEEIILSYSDPRIRYFKQENGGEAAARNTALDHAQGEFIVFQDADDISLPIRFEVLKRHFTSETIGFVHSDMIYVDENCKPILYLAGANMEPSRMLRFFLKEGTPFNNPSMMVRREVFEGFRYDTDLLIGTDTDMVFRTARNWNNVHVPQPLLLYRRHSKNLTNRSDYTTNFLHIQKLLERHSLEELIPELDWQNGSHTDNQARACAIISQFLSWRSMNQDWPVWIEKAKKLASEPDAVNFVGAIASALAGNMGQTLTLLKSCSECNHLIENYIGVVKGFMGAKQEASFHFRRALELKPDYNEPIDNLKNLGWRAQFSAVGIPRIF